MVSSSPGVPPSGGRHAIGPLPAWAFSLVEAASESGEDIMMALRLADGYGATLPTPGSGETATRWSVLAAVANINLTVARVLEAHSDALAILTEAGVEPGPLGTWGVFAAESPGQRVAARAVDGAFDLTGTKPWCSLAEYLDAALVTAYRDGERQLFRVDLRHPSVRTEPADRWVARGLRTVTSASVTFTRTPAEPVGAPGWYLARAGFAWGGIGVAAAWHGGAIGLYDTLREASASRTSELAALHLGTVDVALHASATSLADAAMRVDAGDADGADGRILAYRVRAVVADAVERTIRQVGHALGPAPLAFDEDHVRRVADLQLYVRQHHGERDLAALGVALDGASEST
jgi:alkylation response protein AidB-like acyl-CoA dehydrogenase